MVLTTSENIPGKTIKESLGIARSSTLRTKNFGTDFLTNESKK